MTLAEQSVLFFLASAALGVWYAARRLGTWAVEAVDPLVAEEARSHWHGAFDSRLWREDSWARSRGLERVGLARNARWEWVALWSDESAGRTLAVTLRESGLAIEFLTVFSRQHSLTTANDRAVLRLACMSGEHLQVFLTASLDALEARHLEAERRLLDSGAVRDGRRASGPSALQSVREGRLEHALSVTGFPFSAAGTMMLRPLLAANRAVDPEPRRGGDPGA